MKLYYLWIGKDIKYFVMSKSETDAKEAIRQKIGARWKQAQYDRQHYFKQQPKGYQEAFGKYESEMANVSQCSVQVLKTDEVFEL